jgi:hypothetical protein
MKEKVKGTHENNGNYGKGVFTSGRKWALGAKRASEHPLCQRKAEGGFENGIANMWSRQRITKNHHKGPRGSWARNQMGNPRSSNSNHNA